jgi:predicted aldo/keto reductase-like oxidoreductase
LIFPNIRSILKNISGTLKLGFGFMRLPLTVPDDLYMVDTFLERGFNYFVIDLGLYNEIAPYGQPN